jgi:hypothetical protein
MGRSINSGARGKRGNARGQPELAPSFSARQLIAEMMKYFRHQFEIILLGAAG